MAAAIAGLGFVVSAVNAQTVINNGTINTTNVFVQRAPTVFVERSPPVRQTMAAVPTRPAPTSFPYQQRDLLAYMSPRCAQLYEVQLMGGARRTSRSASGDVREEYRLSCHDAVSEAQKAHYQDKLKTYNMRQESDSAAKTAADQTRTSRAQCDELLRILASKRKRVAAMTEGERTDHERSESNYRARCASS
jgi:hypothetical protein